jgi:hypothetical protein
MFIPDPDLEFLPSCIPVTGVKKAPDPGTVFGSATLVAYICKRKDYTETLKTCTC